jgi:hypothetical protein
MKIFKILLLICVVFFIVIQFIRPQQNQRSGPYPDDVTQVYRMPAAVQTILKNACYDCHSNHTAYPWYTAVQPLGWMMAAHIRDGKAALNFNTLRQYSTKRRINKIKRMKTQMKERAMPLPSYTLLHPAARLTAVQQAAVFQWIDTVLNTAE